MAALSLIAGVMAPILAMASVGLIWRWTGHAFPTDFAGKLVSNVAGPCLVVSALAGLDMQPGAIEAMAAASIAAILVSLALGWLITKAAGHAGNGLAPAMAFGNTGNLGLSVAIFAFGDQGLALGAVFFVISFIASVTIAPALFAAGAPLKTLATSPLVHAGAAGWILFATGANLPAWLDATLTSLGAITIPLMLISLGYTLSGVRVAGLAAALPWSAARLAVGAGAGLAATAGLGLDGLAASVLILQSSMPTGVFIYVLAEAHGGPAETIAGVILLSTLLFAIGLPVALVFLL